MNLLYTIAFIVFLMLLAYASLTHKKKSINKPAKRPPVENIPAEHPSVDHRADKAA